MRPVLPLAALSVVVAAVLGTGPASAATSVVVQTTRLPGLPGSQGPTLAYAVDRAGDVAGAATTPDGALHAVVWSGGALVDLDRGRPVRADVARGLNARGQVVGEDRSGGYFHTEAVLWQDGHRTVLPRPTPPASDFLYGCFALSIDETGLIGGYCDVDINSSVNSMPVLWRAGRPSVPWTWGRVDAVRDGALAGRQEPSFDGEVLQAVVDRGAGPVVLPPLVAGSTQDEAFAVAGGVVAGRSGGRPVLWRGGRPVALPAPSGTGAALGLNRWGTAVGVEGSAGRPVAWKRGRLVPLGPARGAAVAVGDRGTVVGWSTGPAGRTTALRWRLTGG